MRMGPSLAALTLVLGAGAGTGAEETQPFRIIELPGPGRTVVAGFADLDGDGRTDVYSVALYGVPPRARRELRIHFQRPDGSLRDDPDWTGEVEEGAAAFDVADLPDGPGEEILLLLRHEVKVVSFAGRVPTTREIVVPGEPTVAVAPDERGLDRLRIARDELGPELRLLVPGLGDCAVMTPEGELLGRIDVGHRANFFIPPRPGPLVDESEVQQFYDFPRLEIGDVDGDGHPDIVASNRHELRVFRQRPDGRFAGPPDLRLALERLTEKDQIRGSGNVRVDGEDLDGDGRLDLLITSTTGGLLDAMSETTIHVNRGGSWNLDEPDQKRTLSESWNVFELLDLDGDGRVELMEARIPLSILEMVEVLVTQAVDIEVGFYRSNGDGTFETQPFLESKLGVGVEFERFATAGFVPTVAADLNGDRARDRLHSADGEALEIYLG
ncbi:MAG: VCBS repeat-containing protein, partial [Thermoanaerobaculia bacterium]|nr:VCBS repeat-containing protein [Thermoanaerobaculia bacterium]